MKSGRRPETIYEREHPEPGERTNSVPWILGFLAAALTVWGVGYFLLNPGLAPHTAAGSAGSASTASATSRAADGGQIFASRCASCHQATGAGLPGVFPPLGGSEWVNGDTTMVARILLLGINGKIAVAGNTFSGSMPAFGTTLSDAEIAAVGSYVRANFGNKSSALTADAVKAERTKLGTRSTPWSGGDDLKSQQ